MNNYCRNPLKIGLFGLIFGSIFAFNSSSANSATLTCNAQLFGDAKKIDDCSYTATTNALNNEDTGIEFPPGSGESAPDEVFNVSGSPALPAEQIELALSLPPGSLSTNSFIQAFEASAFIVNLQIESPQNRSAGVKFDWTFATNEEAQAPPILVSLGWEHYDYFIETNKFGVLATSSDSSLVASDSVYKYETSGSQKLRIPPDSTNYQFIVVDEVDSNRTSSMTVSFSTVAVPEPLTILGTVFALGFGTLFKYKK